MPRIKRLAYLLEARCMKATFMVNQRTNKDYCLYCYARSSDSPDDYRITFKHYATRGVYNKRCYNCDRSLITLKFAEDCSVCIRSCALIISNMITRRLNLHRVYYCYDNKRSKIRHFEVR